MPISNAYKRKKRRGNDKKREELKKNDEDKTKKNPSKKVHKENAKESIESTSVPKFKGTYNTCRLHHN